MPALIQTKIKIWLFLNKLALVAMTSPLSWGRVNARQKMETGKPQVPGVRRQEMAEVLLGATPQAER
jgi:hypothetical protein